MRSPFTKPIFPGESSAKLAWLIRVRWVALVAQAVAGIVGFRLFFLYRELAWPFFGTLATLLLFNIYSRGLLRADAEIRDRDLFVQLVVDETAFVILLVLSGGTRNPFSPLCLVYASLGALILRGKQARWFLALLLLGLAILYRFRTVQILSGEMYVTELVPLVSLLLAVGMVWAMTVGWSRSLSGLQQQLYRAKMQQSRLDHLRALGALTSEFSHQFATPLNTLKLRLGRLARQSSNGTAGEVASLLDAVGQCEGVLRQIVSGPLEPANLEMREVAVEPFLREILESWSAPVELTVAGDGAMRWYLPPVLFTRALFSLLDNARQADGRAAPRVAVRAETGQLCIEVQDRGPGWPEQIKKKIGQPFLSDRPGGTGLGLYNALSLCEALGGSFTISDREGGGAVASLVFPTTPAGGISD